MHLKISPHKYITRGIVIPLLVLSLVPKAFAVRLWSDPATWGGTVPGPTTDAVITGTDPVVLDVSSTVSTLTVSASSTLRFSTTISPTLCSRGNVVVEGTLEMKPASVSNVHTLRITEADEGAFVGGGMSVLATDKGLWVMEAGRLDLAGSTKTPWLYATGSIAASATTVALAGTPSGWQVGDEVAIAPTSFTNYSGSNYAYFDQRTITAISGSTITLNAATTYAHPSVAVSGTKTMTAEVMNLTRNVRIEGMPPAYETPRTTLPANSPGRSHVFIHNMDDAVVHSIKYTAIRYMGPRQADEASYSLFVPGRYGLHFHHCGTNSIGSTVEGVVVRDCGSHAFVPHASDGITLTKCISYNTFEDAYWWDPQGSGDLSNAVTNSVHYNGCIASKVKCDPYFRGYGLTGFLLGIGDDTRIENCVATGIYGNTTSSGYQWPADANGQKNVWQFVNNVSHNNAVNGAYVWQNDNHNHDISTFVSYHNNQAGVDHGAYNNTYFWHDNILYGNGRYEWLNHNVTWPGTFGVAGRYTVQDMEVDGGGTAVYGYFQTDGSASSTAPALLLRWKIKGYTAQAVRINDTTRVLLLDIVNWTVGSSNAELEPADFLMQTMIAGSRVRVQRRDGTAYQITPQTGSTTTFDITTIPAFYP